MRLFTIFMVILLWVTFALNLSAQDEPTFETITLTASDDLALVGDMYLPDGLAETGNPTVLLFHMLGGNRGAYAPLIPDVLSAGYVILNVDMRGHGDTGGAQNWDLAVDDVQVWLDWMHEQDAVDGTRIVIIGGSIGSNVALIGCANDADCVGAIALSPGLDYRGVQPESAVVDGFAERSVLLVASHRDGYSAESVEQLFMNATGTVSAQMYPGSGHGTNLFRSDYDRVSHLILSWLDAHLAHEDM